MNNIEKEKSPCIPCKAVKKAQEGKLEGKERVIAVVGGDRRTLYAAKTLAKEGFTCKLFALGEQENPCVGFDRGHCFAPYRVQEVFKGALCALLPLPLSTDGQTLYAPFSDNVISLSGLEQALPLGLPLFGGGFRGALWQSRREDLQDFLIDDSFATENALPSAEGALALAILHHPDIIKGTSCAVLGFGRIGKELTRLLLAVGAMPFVFARREESLKDARALGAEAHPLSALYEMLSRMSILFNTIPAEILKREHLSLFRKDALYIELASAPYGISAALQKDLPFFHLPAQGLPGKYAPRFAGNLIAQKVKDGLLKRGLL